MRLESSWMEWVVARARRARSLSCRLRPILVPMWIISLSKVSVPMTRLTTVPINGGELDYSGNCGNMASGVGPFAVE